MYPILTWICWIAFGLLVYTYFGYPLFLKLWSRVFTRPIERDESIRPTLSFVLPVYNEEKTIRAKLENLLELDYPKDKIDFLIGSDSNDGSNAIIEEFVAKDDRFKFFSSNERRGKVGALNELVEHATGEILIMSDVHELFEIDALLKLVRNFGDDQVGAVSGQHVIREKGTMISGGTNIYWKYERFLQRMESKIWSLLSVDGCIYAVRRKLFKPLSPHLILDDDVVPLQVALEGYRVIYDEEAVAYSDPLESAGEEMTMRLRFQAGHYQNFLYLPQLFIPFYSPVFFYYVSHKFLRVMSGWLLIVLFATSLILADQPVFYFLFFAQVIFYLMAFVGLLLSKVEIKILPFYVPLFFCIHNYATIGGFYRLISRRASAKWDKVGGKPLDDSSGGESESEAESSPGEEKPDDTEGSPPEKSDEAVSGDDSGGDKDDKKKPSEDQ